MKLHEYQAKALLARFGVAPLLLGKPGWTPQAVVFNEFRLLDDGSMIGMLSYATASSSHGDSNERFGSVGNGARRTLAGPLRGAGNGGAAVDDLGRPMPGSGGLRAANFMFSAAPKDGTAIGTFARNLPLVTCHVDEINQVVLNLLLNAIQAVREKNAGTAARGRITVGTRRAGRYAESAAELERAANAHPAYADVHCQSGLTRLALGEFGAAREALEKSLALAPGYAKAHYLNGLARYALGDTAGASESLDRALGLKPDLFAVRLERGLYALRDRRWSDAAVEFEAVLASAPRHADARCLLGTALAALGQNDAAARCFEEALMINPGYVDARKKLAHLHYVNGDNASAERHVRSAMEAHPDYADLHKILGDVRMQANDADGARACYAEAAKINPDYADAVFGLVIALRREGRGREADVTLRRFVARHPENVMARTLLTVDKIPLPDA